jgi:hypothetical protein
VTTQTATATTDANVTCCCLELADWIITGPQGGQLAASDVDMDVLLDHALARVPPGSSVRIGIWRA